MYYTVGLFKNPTVIIKSHSGRYNKIQLTPSFSFRVATLKKGNIMKKYTPPDFDITIFKIEDIITASSPTIGDQDPNGDGWWG